VKAPLGKAFVARDCCAEVARADQRDFPFAFYPQDLPKLIFEISDLVTRSLFAETTEMREVFANLCRANAQSLA